MAPTRAPWAVLEEDDSAEELDEAGDAMAGLGASLPSASTSRRPQHDLSPLSASGFFSQALEINPPNNPNTFRAYITPPSSSSRNREGDTPRADRGTYLVCHHGAGAGGLSFAALAKEIRDRDPELGVLAFDARGHGKTRTRPQHLEHDLSLAHLTDDVSGILEHTFPDPTSAPSLLLMGHSMGAAPVLQIAPQLIEKGYDVPGVIVLDVVEGTAVESLPLMKGILSKRPKMFPSVVDGIHWHVSSSAIRNATSARISVPSYLIPVDETQHSEPGDRQTWRTDLAATAPYWAEWWTGLSQKFLSTRCARLLVLAGQERLDKDLMVGQMQGKFQLEVMQDVGHYLHEDEPAKLASVIIAFWRRNTRVLILPPKVGETPAQQKTLEVHRVGES